MKTCATLTILIVNLAVSYAADGSLSWQDGVMIEKIGSSYIYIFPSSQGRIKTNDEPAGKIQVGDNITIMYALKIIRSGKARFIALDGSKISEKVLSQLKPRLSTVHTDKQFGFLIKDTTVPKLDITINRTFMAAKETQDDLREKVAREGNLNVLIGSGEKLKILKVIVD